MNPFLNPINPISPLSPLNPIHWDTNNSSSVPIDGASGIETIFILAAIIGASIFIGITVYLESKNNDK